MRVLPDGPVNRSRNLLIYALTSQASTSFDLRHFGAYSEELPARLGRDEALDAVVECFITSYALRRLIPAQRDTQSSLELVAYGRAVKTLRENLVLSSAQDSEETLCAALLLAIYEFFLQKPIVACVSLAGGVASILRAWGPSGITSTFRLSIFEVQFVGILTHALIFGTDCFLAAPGWDLVFQACPTLSDVGRQLWLTIAHIPHFLSDVREVSSTRAEPRLSILQRGDQLRLQALGLEDQAAAALSKGCVYHTTPELYGGQLPPPPGCPSDVDSCRKVVFRVVWVRLALVMINDALRRLCYTDEVRFGEEKRASEWLYRTMVLAVRLGPINASFCTVAGAAVSVSAKCNRRSALLIP